jgi:hypothetical protein
MDFIETIDDILDQNVRSNPSLCFNDVTANKPAA